MKKLLLSLMACTLLAGMLHAQTNFARIQAMAPQAAAEGGINLADDEYLIGYCSEEIAEQGVGAQSSVTLSGAVLLAADQTEKMAGNTLKKVCVGFVNNKPTNASVWVKKALTDATPLAVQSIEKVQAGWNVIEFSTPYVMDGEPIYIGFTITQPANSGPLSFTGEDMENGSLLSINSGDWNNEAGFGRLSLLAVVTGDNLPQNDLTLTTIKTDNGYCLQDKMLAFTFPVLNNGKKAVTSYEVSYQIGTGAPVTETITTNLAYRQTETLSKTISVAGLSKYNDLTVTIGKVNGIDDENVADNKAVTPVYVYTESFPRKILLEHFTTEKCPNCPYGDAVLDKCMEDRNNVIWVAHHVGYGTDPFTVTESNAYLPFFGPSYPKGYAPAAMADRTRMFSESYPIFGIAFTSPSVGAGIVNPYLDLALSIPAFVTLNISGDYDPETNKLKVKVTGEKTSDLDEVGTSPVITVFLTEDKLAGNQSGAGKVIHDHVLRKVMSNKAGDALTWDGNNYSYEVEGTLKTSWKFEDMKIIAFIHDWNKDDYNKAKVYNTEAIALYDIPNSIESAENDEALRVSVENGSVKVDGDYNRLDVYTVSGSAIDNVNLAPGIYFVKVSGDNSTKVTKVLVK